MNDPADTWDAPAMTIPVALRDIDAVNAKLLRAQDDIAGLRAERDNMARVAGDAGRALANMATEYRECLSERDHLANKLAIAEMDVQQLRDENGWLKQEYGVTK